jgi:hypothetical protein
MTIEIGGELPPWLFDNVFKGQFQTQLEMYGFDVDTLDVTSKVSGVSSRGFKATLVARYGASSNVSSIVGAIRSCAERAGAWTPTATIPSYGQPTQIDPASMVPGALGTLAENIAAGLGSFVKGAGEAPERVFSTITLVIVGVVVIAGFIAFGPNVGALGKKL